MTGVKVVLVVAFAALVALAIVLLLPGSPSGSGSSATDPNVEQTEAAKAALAESNRRAEAQRILSSLVQKYRGLETYRDVTTWTYELPPGADLDGFVMTGGRAEFTGSLEYASPNRIRLILGSARIYSDGETIRHVDPEPGVYAENEAPRHLSVGRVLPLPLAPAPRWMHPAGTMMLSHGGLFRDLYPIIEDIPRAETEKRGDEPGRRVHTTARIPWIPGRPRCPVTWWISAEDELLREVRIDLTAALGSDAASASREGAEGDSAGKRPRALLVITFDDIETGVEIPDDVFTFEPESGWRRTTAFGLPTTTRPTNGDAASEPRIERD